MSRRVLEHGQGRVGGRRRVPRPTFLWLICLAALLVPEFTSAEERPEVHVYIFLSSTCPHCELVEEEALRELGERLHCNIRPHYHNVDSLSEYKRMVRLEERLGDTGNDLPVVFMGEHVLGGVEEIERGLKDLLVSYRDSGLPPLDMPRIEEEEESSAREARAPIYLAYFETPACRECDRVTRLLGLLHRSHHNLTIRKFGTESRSEQVLLEAMCERAGVPQDRRLLRPAVFVGGQAFIQEQITEQALSDVLQEPSRVDSKVPWNVSDAELQRARARLSRRADAAALPTVITGGLVDGVNPCAFATIAFLVTCLSGMGAVRSRILSVGIGFCAGVFVAYFLVGVALREVLRVVDMVPWLSRTVTWMIVGGVFVCALLSFWDARRAFSDDVDGMTLKLPSWLRRRMNAMIARHLRARWLLGGTFLLGLSVSLLEFVCTGQVYLPLIRYMTAQSGSTLRGLWLLLVYDAAFVLPLVAVFSAVYFGLRSERLVAAFKRHVAASKVALGLFFTALGGLLLRTALLEY